MYVQYAILKDYYWHHLCQIPYMQLDANFSLPVSWPRPSSGNNTFLLKTSVSSPEVPTPAVPYHLYCISSQKHCPLQRSAVLYLMI